MVLSIQAESKCIEDPIGENIWRGGMWQELGKRVGEGIFISNGYITISYGA